MKKRLLFSAAILAAFTSIPTAQTRITPPSNKYSVEQDVQLGREAAQEARQQLPIMKDDAVTSYVEDLGSRLVDAIPAELRQPAFRYTFETVNVREINAFALPGGPMFVNRGMLEAASTEGEIAGVMAHEISHVALRHGTAQASKAGKYQAGGIAGAILGAIVGGTVGSVIAQGTQFGLGAAFMRFGREYEKQADIKGSHIMATAGYDPRDMANMFKAIEKEGGSSGPEWLSDHPNPGNRSDYINKEAAALRVTNPITKTSAFERLKAHLRSLPRAPTTEEATRKAKRGSSSSSGMGRPTGQAEPPSNRYVSYTEGNVFQISVPSNWQELTGSSAVTFAPNGAYGEWDGQTAATDAGCSTNSGYQSISVSGRRALQTSLGNVSDVTGREEVVQLVTTQMNNGTLFYVVAVAPRDEFNGYQSTFQRVIGSIRLRN